MFKVFIWFIVLAGLYYTYQVGLFNNIMNYFSESSAQVRQEKIIEHEDGGYTTVRYRNVIDLLMGR